MVLNREAALDEQRGMCHYRSGTTQQRILAFRFFVSLADTPGWLWS